VDESQKHIIVLPYKPFCANGSTETWTKSLKKSKFGVKTRCVQT